MERILNPGSSDTKRPGLVLLVGFFVCWLVLLGFFSMKKLKDYLFNQSMEKAKIRGTV